MNKPINPNIVSVLLFGMAILLLIAIPISIRFVPNQVTAQETLSATEQLAAEPVAIAQAEVKVVEYTVRTQLGGDPTMAFVGVGGTIDGVVNPELVANVGDTIRITVINGDPVLHDLKIDAFGVHTGNMMEDEQSVTVEFVANQPGEFEYYCSVPGHRDLGMKGMLRIVGTATEAAVAESSKVESQGGEATTQTINLTTAASAATDAVSIIRNPADVPPPVGDRGAQTMRIDMRSIEVNGQLADGTTYNYMTFDGQVPGPMIRVRVGDTIELHLHNEAGSMLPHSIDLHAATGPGGGAVYAQTLPGQETAFTFQVLQPGLYVYHCATPSIGHHISSGMYGLILVEPVGGLPPVDHEFYVMQGELYTAQSFGTAGHLDFSHEKMLDEDAEYFMFNGAAGALTQDEYAMHAAVGDTVRIYFGVGGPNATSSFHLIGEIFDRVYDQASLTAPPLSDVQTTTVAPGGATVVEFKLDVPGRYILVDHALSRLERGLAGYLYVTGEENLAIFHGEGAPNDSGH